MKKKSLTISPKMSPQATIRQRRELWLISKEDIAYHWKKNVSFTFNVTHSNTNYQDNVHCGARTTDKQWRHKSKKSENLGRCGKQNMLWPYLKIWEWELIFSHAVKPISSPGVRSPWSNLYTVPWVFLLIFSSSVTEPF